MIDKINVLSQMSSDAPISIEIGCGDKKRDPASVGIDILDAEAVDIVGDALEVLRKMPSGSVKMISSVHVFEHIPNLSALLFEIERVLTPDGEMSVTVPHFSNPFYYSDPTHVNFFGLYTFSYYCEDNLFRRQVPQYATQKGLELKSVRLIFKSFPPRYLMHGIRKVFQGFFNLSPWMQEIYEDSFSGVISCYELQYTIIKS